MKIFGFSLMLILGLCSMGFTQNYSIDRYVIASGGGEMSSTNYSSNGTIGQPTVGSSSSDNYGMEGGFWAGGGGGAGGGCDYVVGDVNGSDNYNGLDITYGVNFFKYASPTPQCPECTPCNGWYYCGDVNGSCNYNGLDITYGVNYFKFGSPGPAPCGDCPPGGGITITSAGENGNQKAQDPGKKHENSGLRRNARKSAKTISDKE